jgi:hypothetical protein
LVTEKDQYRAEVEKIANSTVLHGSESLCKLLRYLAASTIENPGTHLKEYQIATEVFARPSQFDPQTDSTVRVQAGRLRQKLHDYYSSEGAHDSIVVDLPKGSYALGFHRRHSNSQERELAPERIQQAHGSPSRTWALATIILAILLLAAIAVILVQRTGGRNGSAEAAENSSATALGTFWRGFTSVPDEPWVIFSNAAFVGRPESGMRYLDKAHDIHAKILDHYTGVGEVLAVHELDRTFAGLHRPIVVKRGSLLSLDDVKNNNLIFIGSPAENLTLLDIPGTQDFVFRRPTEGPRKGDLAIINVHPQPGERQQFLGTPNDLELIEDYAVVSMEKGLNPARAILILAGTTTIGTQAAVEFVCRQSSVEKLLLRLSVSPSGEVQPFEAVLHVKVTRGVPLETELVALHKSAQ